MNIIHDGVLMEFADVLCGVLTEEFDGEFKSAVGIVQNRDKWLLGLARKTNDDRTGKWVHPGGGIKSHETPERAAVREVFEETGIRCRAVDEPFRDPKHKNVAFVHCKTTTSHQKINVNHEFSAAGFFTLRELRSLKPLYGNVRKLIDRVR